LEPIGQAVTAERFAYGQMGGEAAPLLRFEVVGLPVPQGSKTAFVVRRKDGRVTTNMTEGKRSAALKEWRAAIAAELRAATALELRPFGASLRPVMPLEGPVGLRIIFWLPRPSSAPKHRVWPDRKPDASHLLRAAEDAMTGIAYRDDAQIVRLEVEKRYAIGRLPGCKIELRRV
jgi:Holliday junction resolvase RusA-like endonuclease